MFCRNCGKEFQEEVKFCDECGTYIGTEESKMVVTTPVVSYENVFVEKDEKLLGKLGDGYVNMASIINTASIRGKAKKINALLTDKRLYLQGRMSVGAPGARYKFPGIGIREKVLEHKDIVSTEIMFLSQTQYIVAALLWFIAAFLYAIMGVGGVFVTIAIILFVLASAFLICGLFVKQRLFVIEYTGGRIQFTIKNAESLEAEEFLKKINSARIQKQ